jgi:hypothetical protein
MERAPPQFGSSETHERRAVPVNILLEDALLFFLARDARLLGFLDAVRAPRAALPRQTQMRFYIQPNDKTKFRVSKNSALGGLKNTEITNVPFNSSSPNGSGTISPPSRFPAPPTPNWPCAPAPLTPEYEYECASTPTAGMPSDAMPTCKNDDARLAKLDDLLDDFDCFAEPECSDAACDDNDDDNDDEDLDASGCLLLVETPEECEWCRCARRAMEGLYISKGSLSGGAMRIAGPVIFIVGVGSPGAGAEDDEDEN